MSKQMFEYVRQKLDRLNNPIVIGNVREKSYKQLTFSYNNEIKIENVECYLKGKRLYVTTTSSMYVG